MPLSGSMPTQEEQRLKAYLYGPPGGGKTLATLQFKNSYIIDTAKETSRYWKLIQQYKSEVFNCSDFYKIKEELIILRDEPHRFQTLVIDEISTPYQKLQRSWTDRFILALERKKAKNKVSDDDNLLEDFGYRYWDKVKRDWKEFIDLIRQLDMNVIVTAHQKNKYGLSQQIIGITSDSDKDDEYVWDFVFHIIKRGKDYKAVTEKQRVLPVEIDPESKRFPDEFDWNYDNLIKFYHKQYIEQPTKNSLMLNNNNFPLETKKENIVPTSLKENSNKTKLNPINKPNEKRETIIPPEELPQSEPKNNIEKIKALLRKEEISVKDFKSFLIETCKWKDAKTLSEITPKHQKILIEFWDKKIMEESKKQNKEKDNIKNDEKYDPTAPMSESQKQELLDKLEEAGVKLDRFLKGFEIKKLEDIPQEGAANMLKNFKVMVGALL